MAEDSKIEWCHHTFNPWIGCTKVGPGCDHCYAEADFDKRRHVVQWGAGQPRKHTAPNTWALPQKWNARAERLGVRYRVFCASLADVFDNEVRPAWRADLFTLIEKTPNLDWLLVTKRIGNAAKMIFDARLTMVGSSRLPVPEVLPNVWIGATITNQAEADRDIPKLMEVPAAVRFLSMEPLLGPVSLRWLPAWPENSPYIAQNPSGLTNHLDGLRRIDWVIVGGEYGQSARPLHPNWARSLRDQCDTADVPFLFKQWGEWKPISQMEEAEHGGLYKPCVVAKPHESQSNLDDIYGRRCTVPTAVLHADGSTHDIAEPMAFLQGTEAMQIFRVGKKAAGRLLDGVQHDGYPEVTNA
jgi:protein gp37